MEANLQKLSSKLDQLSQKLDGINSSSTSIDPLTSEVKQVFKPYSYTASRAATCSLTASTNNTGNANTVVNAADVRIRRLANMRKIGVNVSKGRKRAKVNECPFMCDLILLGDPKTTAVPRQSARVILTEHGHVINACQFHKGMSEAQVEATILEAFEEKIPTLCDIEILLSCHSKLVKPSLAPNQAGINGMILHRLFKTKPVYIRPSQQLINTEVVRIKLLYYCMCNIDNTKLLSANIK